MSRLGQQMQTAPIMAVCLKKLGLSESMLWMSFEVPQGNMEPAHAPLLITSAVRRLSMSLSLRQVPVEASRKQVLRGIMRFASTVKELAKPAPRIHRISWCRAALWEAERCSSKFQNLSKFEV